ncbi:MAG: hypothetical protein L6V93_02975 [Clostridiales bacterium]|nr:MAG: hypothetical protein L6V93_02975 [Clostridiales bacterium]
MKREIFMIESNRKIAKNVYEMTLFGDASEISKPGQFVNIKLDGLYLRRPISVCDTDGKSLTLVYKVVGEGTEKNVGIIARKSHRHSSSARQRLRYIKKAETAL